MYSLFSHLSQNSIQKDRVTCTQLNFASFIMAVLADIILPPELDEPVTLVVDASSTEGDGELEVEIFKGDDKVEGAVKFECKDAVLKKHNVEFTPPNPDEYRVVLRYAGTEIEGSPLNLNLSPPKAKKVHLTQPPTGKIRAGQSLYLLFDTYPGGRGVLTASCKGEIMETIPVLVTREGITTVYKVTFLPPQEDEYSLSVFYSGKMLKGAPYKIDLIPVNSNKVQCSKPIIPEDLKGPIEMYVSTEGAGNAPLKASCVGERCGKVPVDIETVSKANFHLKFEQPKRDKFSLSILYGGKSIRGSPFVMDTTSQPEAVKLGELQVPEEAGADKEVSIELDCSCAGPGDVTASCEGQNKRGPVEVTVEECTLRKFIVKFTPKLPDIFVLTLFYDNQLIPGGKFDINLLPKMDAKLVKHLGTFIPDNRSDAVVLTFDASKAGKGELRARVNGAFLAGSIASEAKLTDEAAKEYEVSFVPNCADTYNVDVYWSDVTIPASPICIKVMYPSEVLVTEPIEPELTHNIRAAVDTKFAGPGTLSVKTTGTETGVIDTEILRDDVDNTKYIVSFRPVEPDLYTMNFYFDNTEVDQSPVVINLQQEPTPEPTPVSTELEMTVGRPIVLNMTDVDGDYELTAVALGKNHGEVPISITQNEDGSSNVVFDPSEPDVYTVDVRHREAHVPGSPFIITCKAVVVPPPIHPITKPYLIQYVPEDSVKEVIAYAIHDDTCTRCPLKVRRKKDKTLLALDAEKIGLHYIHVSHGGKEIRGSPFKLVIVPSDPPACRVVDVPEVSYVGEEVVIKVDSSKAGSGDMHIIASVPLGGGKTVFSHKETSLGVFDIKFTPIIPGRHMLHVKWANEVIPQSPIAVVVSEVTPQVEQTRDAASRVVVQNRSVFEKVLSHSDGATFRVLTEKAGQGKLTIKAKGPGNANINVVRSGNGVYLCSVQPVTSGRYHLDILWDRIPIHGHPYELDFTAEKTYIIGDLDLEAEKFLIDVPSEFRVDCSQEEGVLEILPNPANCAEVNITPSQGKDKEFAVEIVPRQLGNHEISIKFAGKHILQSPFHIQVESAEKAGNEGQEDIRLQRLSGLDFPLDLTDPVPEARPPTSSEDDPDGSVTAPPADTKVSAFGPGLEGGVIGQEGNFTIKTDKAGHGKLDMTVHGARGTFQTALKPHPDCARTLLARYDPTNIGQYTIDILWLDEHIEGSPFVIDIKAQETE